ncbi:hypothetical protein LAZ67_3001843 [Cordylochernes scorpioides]|uniref:CCHC-type domain-containing protein n=1 Tax=Cordylochernes scorpioides TaxID=51811 RepID=A0ABY6K7B1_9ARAC|nr:hypothetical protein LAZ67_3001843 [Cordylochernes scorpioides]
MTIERLPTRLDITIKGEAWPAYLSSGIRCSRCRGQGHRRANCPLLAGLANNTRLAPPTTPAARSAAQPPTPASSSPARETPGTSTAARAVTTSTAPRPSPPVAPAVPMEEAPSTPPPVTPAPSLQAPEGPVGPRLAISQHPEPAPPARPDFVAPRNLLPAQKTLGPAAPTPDVEMSIVEETSASSTSSAKNATRVDLDAFIEKHPSVSFAGTDALGLGREEVLDLLSSRTKAQRKGPLLSPPQCDALAGLIGQILDLSPGAASNLYKVLGQVKAELRTTPAVLPTPPLPAPRPAETVPPALQGEESAPAEVAYPPPLPVKMTDEAQKRNGILNAHPNQRSILANFLGSVIERARGGDQSTLDQLSDFSSVFPLKADQMPGRHGLKAHLCAEKSAIFNSQSNFSNNQEAFEKYANLPVGGKDVNLAAPFNLAANPSSNAVAQAHRNWADMTEDINPEIEDNFTLVQRRKRRRGSANSPTANAPSSNVGGSRTDRQPRSSTGWAPWAEEIRTTRAHNAEARAQQASSSEEYCVYIERSPDLEPFHYLRALDRMLSKVNGLYLLGLTNRGLVERFISEGLEVEGTILKAFPFRKRAERITVGNLPFFVADSVIINALSTFGRVTSIAPKLMEAGPYIYNDGRREAFIALHEGVTIERLPTRLEIEIKSETWPAYLTSVIRCSRCHGQGHRRAICPLLAGLANSTRMAPPTTPAGVPPPTTPAPPQRSAAQPPAPAFSDPALETPGAPPAARAAPSAPPPVTPAPSLQAPEGPVGPRPANSQHPEPPSARPDFVAPRDPLPAQKTLGPAAPTPDVVMSIVEETSASSTSSAKNATRNDLDAFIERHPSAQRNRPFLSPPQGDALAGLIKQILDLRPGAGSNIYKVLGQVKAELRTTPAAVQTPPLPAPRPSEPAPLTSHWKQLSPAFRTPPLPAPTEMEEDVPRTEEERCAPPPPAPRLAGPIPPVPHWDTTTPVMATPPPPLSTQMDRALMDKRWEALRDLIHELDRDSNSTWSTGSNRGLTPSKAEEKPVRLGSKVQPSAEITAKNVLQINSSMNSKENQRYANSPNGGKDANLAAPSASETLSSNGAAQAQRSWADITEDASPESDNGYTVVQSRKRRRGPADSPTAAAHSSNVIRGTGANLRPRSSTGRVPRAQEIRTTRAHIVEARARQASSNEDQCVYIERCLELEPYHYLSAIDSMVGGTVGVIQISKMNGHFLVGLPNRALADRLVSEGLEVEGTLFRAFPFRKRAKKITVGNLPFFVEDSAIISALRPYGRVTSIAPKLMKAGPYIYNDGRREAFIAFHEGVTTERLPTRLDITIKGEAWPAYLSSGIKCSRCHGQGHRRANCPLLAGLANNTRMAPPTTPAAVPSTTTSAPPQRSAAQPPTPASSSPARETPGTSPSARAVTTSTAPRPSPPVTPAPSLQAPEGPVGPRPANSQHPEPAPPARPDFVAPRNLLPAQKTLGPAAPTPDVEMSIVEETSASSTSSAKNATRVDLDAFIERHPSVSFAGTDALGLGREEVLNLLSSRTKAQRNGPLLSPPQCDALAGLIRQILDLRPGAGSNLYKVLGQVKAELRTTPAAVPTPPPPAPRPAEPMPPTTHREELTPPLMTPSPPAPTDMEEDDPMTEEERCTPPLPAPRLAEPTPPTPLGEETTLAMAAPPPPLSDQLIKADLDRKCLNQIRDLLEELNYQHALRPLIKKGLDIDNIAFAIVWRENREYLLEILSPRPRHRAILADPSKADKKPVRHGSLAQPCAELSANQDFQSEIPIVLRKNQNYVNPPVGSQDANSAAPVDLAAIPTANAAAQVRRNWADITEEVNPGAEEGFTLVQGRKRRRGSANSPTAAAPSSNAGGSRTIRRPQPSAGSVPRAQEIRVTRAHIAEARARQASSSEEHCVYIEHSPELESFHYLKALDRMLGGTAGVIQITKVNGHQLLGLTNRDLAERLIRNTLRAFPFRKRAERITVGNLPFFVGDSAVINALSPYGRVTSIAPKQMKAGPYVYVDGRRDIFITLHEGITIERLPTRLDINIKGEAWPAYLSSGIRCSRCHGQGHRRAICPLLAGLANKTRMAPPTTPAGVPPPTTPAPPQRSAAQPPAPAPSNPAMEVCSAPPVARAVLYPSAPRPSPPAAPALPMEETPSVPPPVTPAPSLQVPEGPVGPRPAISQNPEPPPARPDFVAPRDPLPAQKTLGPAAPTPDVEMSIVEETSASSTSLAKNATRVDLDAFIEKHPSVSFAWTDTLGLGREEVLDLLSSRTKAQRKGPPCDAFAGLIGQILDLRPGAASNLYKVLGQVKAELKTTPTAVSPTPPLPAPRPAEPTPPAPHGKMTTPAMATYPSPLFQVEEDLTSKRWDEAADIIYKLSNERYSGPMTDLGITEGDITDAVIYPEDREPLLRTCSTQTKNLITEIISAAIERARDSDPFVRSSGSAGQEPGRPSIPSPTGGKKSTKNDSLREIYKENYISREYVNPPADGGNANLAAARVDVISGVAATSSSNGAALAIRNWADCDQVVNPGTDDDFTVVKTKKRRRESSNSPTAATPPSNSGRARSGRRVQSSARSVPRAQEIPTTRAHITEARARQASSSEEHCVYLEHGPELQPFHYLRALDRLLGGTAGVVQVSKVNGHQLLGLANRGLAERLINNGLEVEGTLLRAFPFRKRAERITVSNLPFFVEDSAIINALRPFGRITSIAPKMMKAGPYTYTDGRREAFIVLHEGMTTERLPTRLNITIKGEAWPAYLSTGIKCSRCHGQGHRRANCPLLAGLANNTRTAPPTTPAGVPPPTTPAPPQRSAAQLPAPTPSNPAMEVCSAPPVARAALHSSAPRPSPPAAPAFPMEETPPAPPPVTPAPSLRTPGSREPAAPTPDVEMPIVEETFASSTSSAKNATRVDLDAFIEGHPSVSFAKTDALGLGRKEVLDLLSSRTKAQRKGPLLSPPQCDALAGLIGQILDLKPGAASNLYKLLGQVRAELRTTPAVPPTPPLPAPRPAETAPPAPQGEESAPAEVAYPPPLPVKMTDEAREWWLLDLFKELNYRTFLIPLLGWTRPEQIIRAALHSGEERDDILGAHPNQRSILANFLGSVIERARGGDQSALDQLSDFRKKVPNAGREKIEVTQTPGAPTTRAVQLQPRREV